MLVANGRGQVAESQALSVAKASATLRIETQQTIAPPQVSLTLVQGLAKGDRDERAIEAATELGVSTVVPWQAARSVSRWDAAKAEKGRMRWESITREASKQSLRAWLPVVKQLAHTSDIVKLTSSSRVLVLDPTASTSLTDVLVDRPANVTLVVGPEGGIADEELAQFEAAGAVRVRLGSHILRTSTAGPAAVAAINEVLGVW